MLSWSCAAGAVSLGSPRLLSQAGQPLKVEFPIRVGADEQSALATLQAGISNKTVYDRLGISQKLLDLNPQAMVYRNAQEQLMVLVETVNPVPISEDPFLDLLVTLNWSAGSITKAYTLLLGDVQKITVRSGQTLSEIAAQLAPQLNGASLDQTMMALFKANPDAFASGSINRLEAGAELNKPSQALLRSISPAEANQFVAESNAQWQAERHSKGDTPLNSDASKTSLEEPIKDRLKIGANPRASEEELVAEKASLEQTRARVAELEKNIADLKRLLEEAKGKSSEKAGNESVALLGGYAPGLLALTLIGFTGLLFWLLAKNARRSELVDYPTRVQKGRSDQVPVKPAQEYLGSHGVMPERAKSLFAGIDLDLPPRKNIPSDQAVDKNLLADALRVKLNLARAYITIEDFPSAKKSLEEIIVMSDSIDKALGIEAQALLTELSRRPN
ncbi:FimV/HubP family polar landmark protein [Polynucleobacter antarcticus]|uniref:FimV/HubP family polar landmark protein n=1 Tax=Polynucleobacter antarcticus TaxID=1743162 RepID=UPI0020C6558B|nr:FimV/HubP family polar landmark protein [Polynucleobacter antarcticus]